MGTGILMSRNSDMMLHVLQRMRVWMWLLLLLLLLLLMLLLVMVKLLLLVENLVVTHTGHACLKEVKDVNKK